MEKFKAAQEAAENLQKKKFLPGDGNNLPEDTSGTVDAEVRINRLSMTLSPLESKGNVSIIVALIEIALECK